MLLCFCADHRWTHRFYYFGLYEGRYIIVIEISRNSVVAVVGCALYSLMMKYWARDKLRPLFWAIYKRIVEKLSYHMIWSTDNSVFESSTVKGIPLVYWKTNRFSRNRIANSGNLSFTIDDATNLYWLCGHSTQYMISCDDETFVMSVRDRTVQNVCLWYADCFII